MDIQELLKNKFLDNGQEGIFATIRSVNTMLISIIEFLKVLKDSKLSFEEILTLIKTIQNTFITTITQAKATTVNEIVLLIDILNQNDFLHPMEKKTILLYFSGVEITEEMVAALKAQKPVAEPKRDNNKPVVI